MYIDGLIILVLFFAFVSGLAIIDNDDEGG
jgi:hypothetical protein